MSRFEIRPPGWILKPALVTTTRLGNGKSWIQFQEIYSTAGKIHWAGREKSILGAKETYSGWKVGGWLEKLRAVAVAHLHQNRASLPNLVQRKDSPLNAEEKQWLNLTSRNVIAGVCLYNNSTQIVAKLSILHVSCPTILILSQKETNTTFNREEALDRMNRSECIQ